MSVGIAQAKKNRLKGRLSISLMQLPHTRVKYTISPSFLAIPYSSQMLTRHLLSRFTCAWQVRQILNVEPVESLTLFD